MTQRATLDLTPDKSIVMLHTCLVISHDRAPVGVVITNNPLDHKQLAQVVMHKTRSHGCAVQVARYVRRRFDIEEPVFTHKAARPVEAMVGYACAGGYQHPPSSYQEDVYSAVAHIAATPIATLLKEVAGGHNASRTRYVVYEVRAKGVVLRGVTHRYPALERRYREAPPDTIWFQEVVQVGRFSTPEEARAKCAGFQEAGDHLWTRRPPVEYLRKVLRATPDDIVWTCDGGTAVREYDFRAVVVGPHVYTESMVRHVLQHGEWLDGRTIAGQRVKVLGSTG